MRRSLSPPAARLAALFACAALAGQLSGCGGSHSLGKGFDPAAAVPASAPLYLGATVRPSGALQANARAAGKTLTREPDPYLRLLAALRTPGSPPLDFKRDLAGWLGPQAGVFLSSSTADAGALFSLAQSILSGSTQAAFPFAASGVPGKAATEGAFVLDSTNARAAQAFLAAQAGRAGARSTSYHGVAYESSPGGVSFGLVGPFAVIGSEAALRAVIDANAGGASLARTPAYQSLHAAAPAEALAHVYASGSPLAARTSSSSQPLGLLSGGRPTNVSLLPSASALGLDVDTLSAPGAPAGLFVPQGEAARAVAELPSESYLALGFAGQALGADTQALLSLAALGGTPLSASAAQAPGISVKGLLAGALAPVQALSENTPQARRDFQSWMGTGAIFASGTGLIDLKAGVAITSTNPALSRAAVSKLAAKLRSSGAAVAPVSIPGTDAAVSARVSGLPLALDIADGRDAKGETKFVIALGEASVAAVLAPSGPLSGSASYGNSSAALGEGIQPSLIVQVPTLLAVLEGAGLGEDPTIAPLQPYLRELSTVSGGGRSLGSGIERFRVVLGLRGG